MTPEEIKNWIKSPIGIAAAASAVSVLLSVAISFAFVLHHRAKNKSLAKNLTVDANQKDRGSLVNAAEQDGNTKNLTNNTESAVIKPTDESQDQERKINTPQPSSTIPVARMPSVHGTSSALNPANKDHVAGLTANTPSPKPSSSSGVKIPPPPPLLPTLANNVGANKKSQTIKKVQTPTNVAQQHNKNANNNTPSPLGLDVKTIVNAKKTLKPVNKNENNTIKDPEVANNNPPSPLHFDAQAPLEAGENLSPTNKQDPGVFDPLAAIVRNPTAQGMLEREYKKNANTQEKGSDSFGSFNDEDDRCVQSNNPSENKASTQLTNVGTQITHTADNQK